MKKQDLNLSVLSVKMLFTLIPLENAKPVMIHAKLALQMLPNVLNVMNQPIIELWIIMYANVKTVILISTQH